jgi:hypothetical protein
MAVTTGALWARIVGVVLALMQATSQIAWVEAYPFWAIVTPFISLTFAPRRSGLAVSRRGAWGVAWASGGDRLRARNTYKHA